jgi:hypothetical protein
MRPSVPPRVFPWLTPPRPSVSPTDSLVMQPCLAHGSQSRGQIPNRMRAHLAFIFSTRTSRLARLLFRRPTPAENPNCRPATGAAFYARLAGQSVLPWLSPPLVPFSRLLGFGLLSDPWRPDTRGGGWRLFLPSPRNKWVGLFQEKGMSLHSNSIEV